MSFVSEYFQYATSSGVTGSYSEYQKAHKRLSLWNFVNSYLGLPISKIISKTKIISGHGRVFKSKDPITKIIQSSPYNLNRVGCITGVGILFLGLYVW